MTTATSMRELMQAEFVLPAAPLSEDNAVLAAHWHRVAEQCGAGALEAAARCGEVLLEQKDILSSNRKQGGRAFRGWLEERVTFSRSQAYRYMQLAQKWDEVVSRAAQLPESEQMSVREALRLISSGSKKVEPPPEMESFDLGDRGRVVSSLLELGDEKFGTIYADPPWSYGNQATRACTDKHYVTMSVADICAMPVKDYAAENAQLHLWTTSGFLREAFDVIEAWGFEYRSGFIWCKSKTQAEYDDEEALERVSPKLGIGNYWRLAHEYLLLGIRGSATFKDHSLGSFAVMDRAKHSAKPEGIRLMVERAFVGPRLEIFGRNAVPGWTVLGNEVQRSLFAG